MCKENHDVDNCKKFLELSVNEKKTGTWPKINSFLGAMILSQVTIQQRHAIRELYVKNVRTIIQLLFMVISRKAKQFTRKK